MRYFHLPFALAALALVSLAQGVRFADWNLEDGYIIYRIVRNLLAGDGWAFNLGEVHNASTSVLNTILLAGVSFFTHDIPQTAHALGTVALALCCVLTFLSLRRSQGDVLAILTAALASYLLANNATWGLESYLFAALVMLFVVCEQTTKNSWIPLGFAVLARPDALLLVGMKTVRDLYRHRRLPLSGFALLAAIIAPWAVYSLVTFGQVFPDTLSNKVWQGNSGYWGQGLIYLKSFASHVTATAHWRQAMFAGGALGTIVLLLRPSPVTYLVLFAWAQQAAYMYLNVPAYHWYFAFFDFAMLIAAAECLGFVLRWCLSSVTIAQPLPWGGAALQVATVAGVLWYGWNDLNEARSTPISDSGNRHYEVAIQELERLPLPEGSLAAVEVGTLGWGTQRRILDLTGLTSPNPELISGKHLDEFFRAEPAVVLVHEPVWMFEKALLSDLRFRFAYGAPVGMNTPNQKLSYFVRQHRRAEITEAAVEAFVTSNIPAFKPLPLAEIDALTKQTGDGCVVDTVNGMLVSGQRIGVHPPLLRIDGWALDTSTGTVPTPSQAILRGDDRAYAMTPQRFRREDVANHFGRPELRECGYSLEADIRALPAGRYTLMIAHGEATAARLCDTGKIIVIK